MNFLPARYQSIKLWLYPAKVQGPFLVKKRSRTRKSVHRIVTKFEKNSSGRYQCRGASGRPKFVCNSRNYEKVEASIEDNLRFSYIKRAQILEVKLSSLLITARFFFQPSKNRKHKRSVIKKRAFQDRMKNVSNRITNV